MEVCRDNKTKLEEMLEKEGELKYLRSPLNVPDSIVVLLHNNLLGEANAITQ